MNATSIAPAASASVTSPELGATKNSTGTPKCFASADPRSAVTPRGPAASLTTKNADRAGAATTPTRSLPVDASSFIVTSSLALAPPCPHRLKDHAGLPKSLPGTSPREGRTVIRSRRCPMSALAHETSAEVDRTLADGLSQFALQLTYDEVPAAVRERAKHLILDSVGIALASTKFPFASVSLAALEELGSGNSPVIGTGRRLALRDAVLMNGILIHGLDFDDTHSRGVIHATSSSFPCALALTDREDADGKTLLSAYVAAMEVATRLGAVAKGGFHQVGFHPTGLVGAFGCTLAAARILGLDPDRATMAQGITLSMASGSLEFLEDGAWTKRMHPGWAGVVGITAATLAKHGFIGPRGANDGRFGLFASHLVKYFEQADLEL